MSRIFNEGYSLIVTTMTLLDLSIGQQCKISANKNDEDRIAREKKEARTAR